MELKRVLINKKTIIAFLVLLAVGVGFFVNAQFRSTSLSNTDFSAANRYRNEILSLLDAKSKEEKTEFVNKELEYVGTMQSLLAIDAQKTENYEEYEEIWYSVEADLRNNYPEIAEKFDKNKDNINAGEIYAKYEVLTELSNQLQYIDDYPSYLESIDARAEQMSTVSIFTDDNPLSKLNINNTVKDYDKLKGISIELGNDKPITSVLDFELIHYLVFFFSVVVIFCFVEERKKGLQNVVYSMPNGRANLAVRRAGVLVLSVASANILMYFVLFASAFIIYGGVQDLFRNVQSIEMFQNFVFPMSELQFIFFYVAINILTQLAAAFLVWFLVAFIKNTGMAIGAAGIIFAFEFLLYSLLPIQSNFALLKCINVFYYINPTQAIVKYYNINAFVTVINLFWIVVITSVIIILIFGILSVTVSVRNHPEKTPSRLEIAFGKFLSKVKALYWRIVEKLNVLGVEFYKILIIQKGIVVLAVFAFVLFNSASTDYIYMSGADSIVKTFYEQYSGPITDDTNMYIENLENEINEIDEEFNQKSEAYANGEISEEEYTNASLKHQAFDNKREALQKINERIEYITSSEEQGSEAWLVNPDGYTKLLGEYGLSRQQNYALISIFCIIILMSGIFSFEKRSQMYPALMASYGGRRFLFNKKIICVTILTAVIWAVSLCAEFYDVCSQYTLSEFNAPIKSLEFLSGLPFNISIGAFLAIMYFLKFVIMLSVTYAVCFISSKLKYEAVIIISSVILIIPSILYSIGIEFLSYISISIPLSMMNLMITSDGFTFLIPISAVIVLGAVCLILTKRSWCKESRCKNAN